MLAAAVTYASSVDNNNNKNNKNVTLECVRMFFSDNGYGEDLPKYCNQLKMK